MFSRFILLIISGFFAVSMHGQNTMTLSDCIDYAMTNHPDIRLGNLNITDAEWQIKENRAIAFPQLNLNMNANHFIQQPSLPAEALGFGESDQEITFALENSLGATISLDQLIFNYSYLARIKAAKMYRDYVNIQMEGTVEKLRNRVTDAYLPALVVSEAVVILDSNIMTQEKLLTETTANYQAGFVEQLDVDRIEYALLRFTTERESMVRQREILLDALKFTIHMPIGEELELADDIDILLDDYDDVDPDEPLDYMNRPDYVGLLKAHELSDVQADAFRKYWFPVVSFTGSYDPTFQGNRELYWIPSLIIGARLTMPIYDGGFYKSKHERAVIQSLKLDEQKHMLTSAYDLEIESARKQYNNAKLKLADQERNLELARRIFDSAEIKFREGLGSSFEVTQSQYGLLQSEGDLVRARFELLNSLVAIKKALGKN